MRLQLNNQKSIKSALAIATTVLLGTSVARATDVESTLLVYSEKDRVSAAEGAVAVSHNLDENNQVRIKLTFDALTGASPNGATTSKNIQTYTRPSGVGTYTSQPGQTPLDNTFHDSRVSVNGLYTKRLGRLTSISIGGNFSSEFDYTSLGINSGISRDFNNRNTTITLSGSLSVDKIRPVGGVPIPFASLPLPSTSLPRVGPDDTKKTYDLLLGITQTIDRKTLFRANYSYSHAKGYLNDPYKIVSVVQDESSPNPGEPVDFIYEKRPDTRSKQAIYARLKRYFNGNNCDISYRFFWDDWSLTSHTIDLFYLWDLKKGRSLEPHFRWYHQSASDYYVPMLVENRPLPQFATADYRLSTFSAVTVGLQYAFQVIPAHTMKLTFEYYRQFGDSSPPEIFGSLLNYDTFPALKAIMIRLGYDFSF